MKSRAAKKIHQRYPVEGSFPEHHRTKEIRRYHLKRWKKLSDDLKLPQYIYDEKIGAPVQVPYSIFSWWANACGKMWVKRTNFEDGMVSTIFDGINSGIFCNKTAPSCFETILCKKDVWDLRRRRSLLAEALQYHAELVALYPTFEPEKENVGT